MEVVGAVVLSQGVPSAVEGKPPPGDTVGEAAHHRPEIAAVGLVLLQGVVAQHHVHRTLPAGDGQRPEGRPEGDDAAGQQAVVQSQLPHPRPVPGSAKEGSQFLAHNIWPPSKNLLEAV